MSKKTFTYASEFAILMYLDTYQTLQQTELQQFGKTQKIFTANNPCNIYFILKRSRLSLDPTYCFKKKDFIELKYFIHIQDKKHERKFRMKNKNFDEYEFKTEYPFNYFHLISKKGQGLDYSYKLAVVVDEIHKRTNAIEPLLDFEVLYIGQAYGEDGTRTPIERLDSHSTLQQIYSEAIQRNPDSEIWILLGSFTQKNISVINGLISIPIENENKDLKRLMNFNNLSKPITEKQKINFTEAALIKMFLPKYNKEYKNTFPNPAHTSYNECYNLDINAIFVELDTSEMRRCLYSENKKATSQIPYWQYEKFYFVNNEDRYKIFNNDHLGEKQL